jgi:hypothetical protein
VTKLLVKKRHCRRWNLLRTSCVIVFVVVDQCDVDALEYRLLGVKNQFLLVATATGARAVAAMRGPRGCAAR